MTAGASMAERGRTQIVRGSLSACPTGVIDASRSPNSRLSQKKEFLGYVSPQNRSYHIETKRFIEIHCSSKPKPMKISGLVENRRICSSCGDCDLGRLGGRWTVRRVLRIRRRNYRWRCFSGGCGVGEGRTRMSVL